MCGGGARGEYSCNLITNWLPFKGTPVIIMILMFVEGGTKLEPEGLQDLILNRKNDGLNVSPGNIVFTNSFEFEVATFCSFPPLQNRLLLPTQET